MQNIVCVRRKFYYIDLNIRIYRRERLAMLYIHFYMTEPHVNVYKYMYECVYKLKLEPKSTLIKHWEV